MDSRESDLPAIEAFVRDVGRGDDARASSSAVAALTVALAVDLVAQVAGASVEWDDRGGALAQADAIRARAVTLAAEVAPAYRAALAAIAQALDGPAASSGSGSGELGEILSRVVEPLLAIGELAGDAAALAEHVARSGTTLVRADAVAATMLAASAAEIVVHLVEVNLLVTGDDERSKLARELAGAAAASRESARALER
jgi:hypothetical protein